MSRTGVLYPVGEARIFGPGPVPHLRTGAEHVRRGKDMERLHRLLRLARLRGDRLAIAVLETRITAEYVRWTEAELRMAWGDR